MFANRRSSQKPDEDLYAAFKQSFPEVGPGTNSNSIGQGHGVPVTSQMGSTSIGEAVVDPPDVQRPVFDNINDTVKDQGTTPKTFSDQWRLTPSLLDPSSFAFATFANQQPGYYTPTPGGYNTLWHSSAAGDLHTPGALGLNTPLSLPHSMHGLHAHDANLHFNHFNPQLLHQHQQQQQFHHESFHPQAHHAIQHQPNYAPPSHFLHHEDSGYAAMDDSSKHPTPNHDDMSGNNQTLVPPPMKQHDSGVSVTGFTGEKFRFSTTLNAPTAMVRSMDEIPVTYLNKGQAYTLSIQDMKPPVNAQFVRYRTYVRITFEDEQQRAKPGACWQLWREGRGSNEAHQRGGKLLAVEYVDPNQGGDDEIRKPQIELERASFDGFVVNWHPNNRHDRTTDCSISVRFNFLSTDFSHSKGVKGIPVRLCAKTELINTSSSENDAEVCFAKVKLFRDHGAERKLSNDIAHVKKSIEKLKQQIAQAEAGIGIVGKRKRSGSIAKGAASRSRLQKHKRSWSADSDTEVGRVSAEEDLHSKLVGLQDMFLSTRPMSILYLKGDPEDDPDLYPVKLPGGDEPRPLERTKTWDSRQSGSESPVSNIGSPTPSSLSATPKRKFSEIQHPTIHEEDEPEDKYSLDRSETPERPTKLIKREPEAVRTDVLALDIDVSYKPPPERHTKPIACFYVKEKDDAKPYYRAVYLNRRTVQDLVNGISDKFGIDATRVTRVTHINSKGLQIIVDDDVVREVQEGQDMVVEFSHVPIATLLQPEPDRSSSNLGGDHQPLTDEAIMDPLEMWLNY